MWLHLILLCLSTELRYAGPTSSWMMSKAGGDEERNTIVKQTSSHEMPFIHKANENYIKKLNLTSEVHQRTETAAARPHKPWVPRRVLRGKKELAPLATLYWKVTHQMALLMLMPFLKCPPIFSLRIAITIMLSCAWILQWCFTSLNSHSTCTNQAGLNILKISMELFAVKRVQTLTESPGFGSWFYPLTSSVIHISAIFWSSVSFSGTLMALLKNFWIFHDKMCVNVFGTMPDRCGGYMMRVQSLRCISSFRERLLLG